METKNNWKGWLYLAPVLILMIIFTFYPLINTFIISFREVYTPNAMGGGYISEGWTLENYGKVLGLIPTGVEEGFFGQSKETFITEVVKYSLPNTLLLTVITVPLSILIALLIAVGLNSIKPLKKLFQTIFFMPYVTNSIAVGMVFSVIFAGEHGLWNEIFGLGTRYWIDMTATKSSAMFVLCLYIVWNALPYKILILLSGLQNIDKQYYQAAQIDSAGKLKTFWRITVPLLSPQILYIMITSFIGAFKEYNSIVGLFNGKTLGSSNEPQLSTVVYYIYDNIKGNTQFACAAAVILFIIIMIFTAIQFAVSKKKVHY